jgi:hypothetical protein
MLVLLVVRSTTGTTIELFGMTFLIFGALVVAATELHLRGGPTAPENNHERARLTISPEEA